MRIDHYTDIDTRRRAEYPSLSEFADAYYWQSKGDNSYMQAYLAKVDAVKKKYPKPKK